MLNIDNSATKNILQPNKIGTVTFYTTKPKKVFVLHDIDIVNNTQIRLITSDNKIMFQDIDIIERKDDNIYVTAFDTEIKIVRGIHAELKNNMVVKIAE